MKERTFGLLDNSWIGVFFSFFFFLNLCHFLGKCENAYELRFEILDLLNLGLSDKNTGFEAVRKVLEC